MRRAVCCVLALCTGLAAAPSAADEAISLRPAELNLVRPDDQPAADKPPEALAADESFFKGWSGSVQIGLNGSDGNTERMSFRAGFEATRKAVDMESKLISSYTLATDEGETSENKARVDFRNDWLFKDSKWRVFALGQFEFDDFQEWDVRVGGFLGVGYEFIKNDRTTLLGRAGAGVSKEIGGSRNELIPEALIGGDFEHKLTERQKITASVDFFPELTEIGPYRFNARAGWEILVDPEIKMTLKLGVEDRYDSTPGEGFKRNDLDYFALLVWSF